MAEHWNGALETLRQVHFVGIGGSGMSGLARFLMERGCNVSGSDARPGDAAAALARSGATVFAGHAPDQIGRPDLVVISAAIDAANPELRAARERDVPVRTHAEMLGLLTQAGRGVAVAGTHGKTTTTTLVGFLLERAGRDPTILAGSDMLNWGTSVRLGRGRHVVVEADEFGRRFLELQPQLAVVTSIEPDHLDYYRDLQDLRAAFAAFAHRLPSDGLLITCDDDPQLRHLPAPCPRLGYGLSAGAGAWRARECQPVLLAPAAPAAASPPTFGMQFVAVSPHGDQAAVRLPLVGRHNVANALAALAVAVHEGVPLAQAAAALRHFRGTRRRFEFLGEAMGVTVIDDYAHHPTAVRVTLEAARAIHAGPLWVAFQPHTRHRTLHLRDEFAAALGMADGVVVTAIYEPLGREPEPWPISGADLVAGVEGAHATYLPELEAAADWLADRLPRGSWLLVMGAGDVDRLGPLLLNRLAGSPP